MDHTRYLPCSIVARTPRYIHQGWRPMATRTRVTYSLSIRPTEEAGHEAVMSLRYDWPPKRGTTVGLAHRHSPHLAVTYLGSITTYERPGTGERCPGDLACTYTTYMARQPLSFEASPIPLINRTMLPMLSRLR